MKQYIGGLDVKATSNDVKNNRKSPNRTSFARIRTESVEDPDLSCGSWYAYQA